VHDGDVHDYLGMVMEHNRESKTVKINMKKYIVETIDIPGRGTGRAIKISYYSSN
jgi:hypothetical protein